MWLRGNEKVSVCANRVNCFEVQSPAQGTGVSKPREPSTQGWGGLGRWVLKELEVLAMASRGVKRRPTGQCWAPGGEGTVAEKRPEGAMVEGTEGKPCLFACLLRVAPEVKPMVRPHRQREDWEQQG